LAGDSDWSLSAPTTYTFTTAGSKTLYAWAKDEAGNVSTSLNDSVVITLESTNTRFGSYLYFNQQNQISNNVNTINPNISLIKTTLKKSIKNLEVKTLQIYLNNHNFPIALTGPGSLNNETTFFGSLTRNALIKFQIANGLIGDGIVGPMTRDIINKTITPSIQPIVPVVNTPKLKLTSILRIGLKGSEVIELQKLLREKGYFNLEPTGIFGLITQKAVIKFQIANGLIGDGIVGEMTRALLE